MRKSIAAAALGAFASCLLVGPASAAERAPLPPQTRKDVQCFMIYSSVLGTTKDEKMKQAALLGWTYYLGRVDGGSNDINLFEEVKSEAARMRTMKVQEIGAGCDALLAKRGEEVSAVGSALTAIGL